MVEMMASTISLPENIMKHLRRAAKAQGLSLEEYLIEYAVKDLDPVDSAREYIVASKQLIEDAHKEFMAGDLRQAAEKLWGALALAVKAYAGFRDGRRLSSHRDLWEYKDRVIEDLGEWVRDVWNTGNSMHTCFYEGWCTRRDVEKAIDRITRLVDEIWGRIMRGKE